MMTDTARQSSILSSFIMCAALAVILAALPAASASAQVRQFDGVWRIAHTSASCQHKSGGFKLTIANGTIRGRVPSGTISGTISADGAVRWSFPAAIDAVPVNWEGRLRGNKGTGSYERADGRCRGTFTVRRT
jgi:hypothetical protein